MSTPLSIYTPLDNFYSYHKLYYLIWRNTSENGKECYENKTTSLDFYFFLYIYIYRNIGDR